MAARQADVAPRAAKPPRAMVWVVLLTMSGAVVVVGLAATALVFARLGSTPLAPRMFWVRLLGACALTVISLAVRSVRWIFLLRRAETRIPIRDAYIGYFAGLSLLFTPFLIGEIAVRSYINRARGRVPVLTTTVVNVWERALDLVALGFIAGTAAFVVGQRPLWAYFAVAGAFVSAVPLLRRIALQLVIAGAAPIARRFDRTTAPTLDRLATDKAWWTGLVASVAAWLLPGVGLWLLAGEWRPVLDVSSAELAYAHSAIVGSVLLVPGGVLITGSDMLSMLAMNGLGETAAALTVLGVRLATVGLSVALGALFVAIHLRSARPSSETHFDDIADAYDVQIPESRRLALLETKTSLMREIISRRAAGSRGLDVGCGQGAYVARMRALGLDVAGIDASPGQVKLAVRNVGRDDVVQVGSALNIPASNESYDFVYVINVLHHLGSLEEQRQAFKELFRVLKPGGLLFVHEINTRNMLFRFYMGYVFPSLNCIDEGVERWLRADRLAQYTDAPAVDVRYFTFLPDFIPQAFVRWLGPLEYMLERSRLKVYSAHYMACTRKTTPELMTTVDRTPIAWRDATVILLGAEALAIAVWLGPASIHIVKWPASGPIRLALLAPAWQLAAWAAAAVVVAAAVIVRARTADRPSATSLFGPLLVLWLWAVPYLPWIPDRLPLFLVLAGPLRWVIAGAAAVSILLNTTRLPALLSRLLLLDRRTIFVISLALYLGFGLYSARETGVGGDEPHYLIITESLLRDRDLKIENNHQQRDYRAFYPGELRPDFFERGKNGEIYSIHAPGLPVLILPAYGVAGRFGVVALMAFLAALTMRAVFDLAETVAGRQAAVLTWLASGFTVPFIPHAWMIFPELPGALLVAWGALWVLDTTERSPARWAWRGTALSLLPWLHTKFIVFLAIFGAALAWRLLRRPRSLAAFTLPIAVVTALWLYSFYAIYGSFNPEAPYGSYTGLYVLTTNIPHGLLGLFFDQKFGLFFYSPIYLASVAGGWLILRRSETRFLGVVLLATIAAFVGSTARLYMFWGGSSAPARFLVPLLPCLAPLMALSFAEAKHAVARAVVGLWLGISVAVAIAAVIQPGRFMLFSDAHVGGARILEAIQGSAPLADAAPMFTNPDWASHLGQLALWSFAAAIAVGVLVVVSRLARGVGPWRLAGFAAVAFLAAGAVLAAAPADEGKQSIAQRGDLDVLWRFDGNRFRTLDYQTLTRTTPERFRELTTIEIDAQPSQVSDLGYTAGPFSLPPGAFDARVWFSGAAARDGEVLVAALPRATFGRRSGSLSNPTSIPFELPVGIRRLTVRVADRRVAEAVRRFEIVPVAVVPALERQDIPVRSIESLDARAGAYLIYTDEHAYPEGPVFWSRGTAETTLWVAPAGASRMMLKLSTGPKSGDVAVSVAGNSTTVAMQGGEVKDLAFDLPPGRQVVPLTVQSTVMFRPAEVDSKSSDMRGLGCQVRIGLE